MTAAKPIIVETAVNVPSTERIDSAYRVRCLAVARQTRLATVLEALTAPRLEDATRPTPRVVDGTQVG